MGKITRRLLLGSAAFAALGGAAYAGGRIACRSVPRTHPDFFSLIDMAPDDALARRIGQGALADARLPNDFDSFEAALRARPKIAEALATGCPTTRKTLVQDGCAQDFSEGRTVVIDGWVLSETEASLCAARALRSA